MAHRCMHGIPYLLITTSSSTNRKTGDCHCMCGMHYLLIIASSSTNQKTHGLLLYAWYSLPVDHRFILHQSEDSGLVVARLWVGGDAADFNKTKPNLQKPIYSFSLFIIACRQSHWVAECSTPHLCFLHIICYNQIKHCSVRPSWIMDCIQYSNGGDHEPPRPPTPPPIIFTADLADSVTSQQDGSHYSTVTYTSIWQPSIEVNLSANHYAYIIFIYNCSVTIPLQKVLVLFLHFFQVFA